MYQVLKGVNLSLPNKKETPPQGMALVLLNRTFLSSLDLKYDRLLLASLTLRQLPSCYQEDQRSRSRALHRAYPH
jgi:hypothetical protein